MLALLGLAVALVLLILIGLCLRRFSGDMNMYVRERDPLPLRLKSKSGSQTAGSKSSLDAMSETKFRYLGTPSPSRKVDMFYIFLLISSPGLFSILSFTFVYSFFFSLFIILFSVNFLFFFDCSFLNSLFFIHFLP